MTAKNVTSAVLLAFVAVSVVYLVVRETRAPSAEQTARSSSAQAPGSETAQAGAEVTSAEAGVTSGHKLIAYYFHRTQRCPTCLKIERFSEEALRDAYPEALSAGQLEWRVVNVEDPGNEHFVTDYQIVSGALVLVEMQGGVRQDWRNLERVWELVGDELAFKTYVEAQALPYLELD